MAHDARRTARSNGVGAIGSAPEVAWKRSMGGALAETQVVTHDVDGDGDGEVIFVAAGKISARRADDTQVWASPDIGALRVTGVYDLDGQGGAEVVAIGSSPPGLTVLSASTGSKLWFVPTNSTAIDAFVLPSGSGNRLFLARQLGPLTAYGFSGGIVDPATNQLWQQAASPWSVDMAAGDLDGDGTLDLLRGDDRGFTAMDAATGAVKCSAPALISGVIAPVYFPALSTADVNGDGRAEAILYDYSYYYSEDAGVFVVSCTGSGPVLTPQLLWQQQWVTDTIAGPGNNVNDRQIRYLADGVADLDGQAPLEMVYSLWDAQASTWTTVVRNAATGAIVANRAGEVIEAVADLDADAKAEVLLRDSTGIGTLPKPFFSTLRLYDMDAGTFADKGWMLPNCRTATVAGRRTALVTSGAGTIAARQDTNVNDPPYEVYVFAKESGMASTTDPRPGKLLTVHGPDGVVLHEYDFPDSISGEVLMLTGSVASAGAQAESLVMLTDGGLRLLDRDLVEASELRPGNHARLPVVASLDGVKNLILGVTSADFLIALDGT
jgi:hypothetical protein